MRKITSFRKNKSFHESVETQHLTDDQKELVEEMAEMDFDAGLPESDYDEVLAMMKENEDLALVAEEAADYYFELVNLGPEGFREEFSDEEDEEPYYGESSDVDFSDTIESAEDIITQIFPSEDVEVKGFGAVITFANTVDSKAVEKAMKRLADEGFEEIHSQKYGNKVIITFIPPQENENLSESQIFNSFMKRYF